MFADRGFGLLYMDLQRSDGTGGLQPLCESMGTEQYLGIINSSQHSKPCFCQAWAVITSEASSTGSSSLCEREREFH